MIRPKRNKIKSWGSYRRNYISRNRNRIYTIVIPKIEYNSLKPIIISLDLIDEAHKDFWNFLMSPFDE